MTSVTTAIKSNQADGFCALVLMSQGVRGNGNPDTEVGYLAIGTKDDIVTYTKIAGALHSTYPVSFSADTTNHFVVINGNFARVEIITNRTV